jgi:hypothetical protein
VVTPWQGVLCDRLGHDGGLRERKRPYTTRLLPALCESNPFSRRSHLAFRDGVHGRTLRLLSVDHENDRADVLAIDDLPLRGRIGELSFEQDRGGRFHLLVSTSRRKLYYLRDGRGPILLAEDESRFCPKVHAGAGVYLGFATARHGYRFLQFRAAAYRHRVVTFEEMP